jgi:hypothetical protein
MDTARALDSRMKPSAWETSVDVIIDVATRIKMSAQWLEFLIRLNKYLRKKRAEWKEAGGLEDSPRSTTSDNGGLKDYEYLFESDQKNFGTLNNVKYKEQPINRNELQLPHETDSEDPIAVSSPSTSHKRESTPVYASTRFNPVNKSTIEEEPKPESPASWCPKQASQSAQSPFSEGSPPATHLPRSTHRHQAAISRADDNTPLPYAFYPGPQFNHNIYQAGPQQIEPGSFHSPWQPLHGQAIQPDLTMIHSLQVAGQPSVVNCDIAHMQCAEDTIGDKSNIHGEFYSAPWTDNVMPSHVNLSSWDGYTCDTYQNANPQ